jgi:hypothetical protein
MIQSERLYFRKIEDGDFEIVAAIMRDAGVQKFGSIILPTTT